MTAITAGRWQRIKEVFELVIEEPAAGRECLLERLAGCDQVLRDDVESLLAADARVDDFIDRPAAELLAPSLLEDESSCIGARLGAYRLEREIGRGGMGTVFLAVRADDAFYKRVAVKLIRQGVNSAGLLRRFHNERRILAELEHPNIARLMDGGTDSDGRPYFVMEWVNGIPIDRYCSSLPSIDDRLRLFQDVCSAVHHAHQHLVIHRDLKPSNILVAADGTPKLLDFGIAKLLETTGGAEEATTMAELRLLTPEYASPEQVAGRRVGTSSDVYSLGVILYEIVTGSRPYLLPSRMPSDVLEAISKLPERPSALLRASRGMHHGVSADLDNIIARAMQADPQRRYSSAEQLAEDLERYLDGRPVLARADSLLYRASKFVRRNKVGVTAAILVVMALLSGIVATTRQARIAEQERALAEGRFSDIRRIAKSLMFELHDQLRPVPGSLAARQLLVKRALEYLNVLDHDSNNDPVVQAELAAAYNHVASLTFNTAESLDSHLKAVNLFRQLVVSKPEEKEYRAGLVRSLSDTADVLKIAGRFERAAATGDEAVHQARILVARWPRDVSLQLLLEQVEITQAMIFEEAGDPVRALSHSRKASRIVDALAEQSPSSAAIGQEVLVTESHVGLNLAQTGNIAEGLVHERKALAVANALFGGDRLNAVYRRDLWSVNRRMAIALLAAGDPEAAAGHLRVAIDSIEGLAAADPNDTGFRRVRAMTYIDQGDAFAALNRREQALASYSKGRKASLSLVAADAQRVESRYDLARVDLQIARVRLAEGRRAEAAERIGEAMKIEQELRARGSQNRILFAAIEQVAQAAGS